MLVIQELNKNIGMEGKLEFARKMNFPPSYFSRKEKTFQLIESKNILPKGVFGGEEEEEERMKQAR